MNLEFFITSLVETSIVMSFVALLIFALNLILGNKYSAKWRYLIWIIIVLGFIIPFRPNFNIELTKINTPVKIITSNETTVNNINSNEENVEPILDNKRISPYLIIFALWLLGALAMTSFHLYKYRKFMKTVDHWSSYSEDYDILEVFNRAKDDLNVDDEKILLRECEFSTSPMLVGIIKPTILIPDKEIPLDDLEFILKHELIHYKRKDLWVKFLILLSTIIHWFNPIMYFIANVIHSECESSCDEALVKNKSFEDRKQYGEAILSVIGLKNSSKTVLSTYFYGGKNGVKKRLFSILDMKKKWQPIALFCLLVTISLTLLSANVFSVSSDKEPEAFIDNSDLKDTTSEINSTLEALNEDTTLLNTTDTTLETLSEDATSLNTTDTTLEAPSENNASMERALQVALERTNGGVVKKCEVDYEDGIKIYDIEIVNGQIEYSLNIGFDDMKVYEFKQDTADDEYDNNNAQITADEAERIALERCQGGVVTKLELDYDDDILIYEIEVENGSTEYKIKIDANSGSIIEFKID